ncbi:hypothetical protein AN477_02000 [Alicyclobacillus ferrooxydans]|uniref:Uncharacterized protein n=1 Tax=Alicyclobacillus ferrooxydans TaxID=471514 RepID=A0A0P9D8Q2_9BACL|nr:hypothetical protein AN477_02000 [Alicyclobacillus ferrooxydans]
MCTRADCERHVGQWVSFRTKYGYHVGLVERVTKDSAIVLSPRQHIPTHLASADIRADDVERLDLALAWGGFGRGGYPGSGFGGGAPGAGAYGGGFGGRGGYGWGRWAVSFLIIYVLWGLWLW